MTNEQRQAVEMVGSACSRYEQEAISAVLAEIDRLRALVEAWRIKLTEWRDMTDFDNSDSHGADDPHNCLLAIAHQVRAALALEKEADHA